MITHDEAKTLLETWLPEKQYGSFDSVKKLQEYINQEQYQSFWLDILLNKLAKIPDYQKLCNQDPTLKKTLEVLEICSVDQLPPPVIERAGEKK